LRWCAEGILEIAEKLICHFLGKSIDDAAAKLGQLAAHLCLDVVVQDRLVAVGFQTDFRTALRKAGGTAFALAGDGQAFRLDHLAQLDSALEGRLYRPDLLNHHGFETVFG